MNSTQEVDGSRRPYIIIGVTMKDQSYSKSNKEKTPREKKRSSRRPILHGIFASEMLLPGSVRGTFSASMRSSVTSCVRKAHRKKR